MRSELNYMFMSLFHPFKGFDGVKFENKGSVKLSIILVAVFFIQNVISTAGKGFLYSQGDPDRISVPMIFLVSILVVILWVASNWAVGSLMDTEGKLRETIIVSTYALVPYVMVNIFVTFISNFVTNDMAPFMQILTIVFTMWSIMVLLVGMFTINQVSFSKTLFMIFLTLVGMAIIVFLGVLAYSLFQQMYIFLYTIFSEIMFRV